jgi:tRNA1(Val) A37 N6-methylase TrmN6
MRWDTQAPMEAYDFSPYKQVVDIGGGNGMLLSLLLQTYPHMQAILFDLPAAQSQAKAYFEQAGVARHCETVSGDFFLYASSKKSRSEPRHPAAWHEAS